MAVPLQLPKWHFNIPGTNAPAIGYLVYAFASGTTTFQNTFTDYTGGVANPNPMVCDTNGDVTMWLSNNKSYKFVFTTPNDQDPTTHLPSSPIWTLDNNNTLNLYKAVNISTNTTVTPTQTGSVFIVDATAGNVTLISPSAASAGATFNITIVKVDSTSNSVIFSPTTGTVNGALTFTLSGQYQTAQIFTDGTNWYTVGLSVNTELFDVNMNPVLSTSPVTGPVNSYYQITSDNASGNPILSVISTHTDQGFTITSKNNGGMNLLGGTGVAAITSSSLKLNSDQPINDSSGNTYLKFNKTASAVNYFNITNAATTVSPTISVAGPDTNIDSLIQSKGTGTTKILGTSTSAGIVKLQNQTSNNSNFVSLVPANITANRTYTYPDQNISRMFVNSSSITTSALQTLSLLFKFDPVSSAATTTNAANILSLSYAMNNASNTLTITTQTQIGFGSLIPIVVALFVAGTSTPLGVAMSNPNTDVVMIPLTVTYSPGTTSALAYSLYVGTAGPNTSGNLIYINGLAGTNYYPGGLRTGIFINEYTS